MIKNLGQDNFCININKGHFRLRLLKRLCTQKHSSIAELNVTMLKADILSAASLLPPPLVVLSFSNCHIVSSLLSNQGPKLTFFFLCLPEWNIYQPSNSNCNMQPCMFFLPAKRSNLPAIGWCQVLILDPVSTERCILKKVFLLCLASQWLLGENKDKNK